MTLGWRAALVALSLLGCGGASAPTPSPTAPAGPPLHLAPLTDLAQGAGIAWLVDVEPRALEARAELLPAIELLLPHEKVASFAERSGFDPLSLEELLVASYSSADGSAGDTTLYLGRGALDPARLEALFRAKATEVEGRAVDRPGGDEIVRTWGTVRGERAQLALFGHAAAGLELGRFGPLRVAELFAQERLKRASPALRTGPLARAAELARDADGDPPARAFALGPFEGESAKGLGGLLAASTAAAVAARPTIVRDHAAFAVVLVLTGGWEASADKAADRLRAAFDALSATGLGRLSGLDHPLGEVKVEARPDALRLTVALDALALARGARAAMGAEASEIMSY